MKKEIRAIEMTKNILRFDVTDEPEVPEGFHPLIKFYLDEEGHLLNHFDKTIPIKFIIDALEQWIVQKKKGIE